MSADGPGVLYLDASALVKLVLPEPESLALASLAAGGFDLATSTVGAIETRRAVLAAVGDDSLGEQVEDLLQSVSLVGVTEEIRRAAGMLRPALLRTLDAIHLATALAFEGELRGFVAYDRRLADAASAAGLGVLAPVA